MQQFKDAIELCRKETGNDHKAALDLLRECERLPDGDKITFRDVAETKKFEGRIMKYSVEKGYGFIEHATKQFFFHISNVTDRRDKGDPKIGESVLFLITEGRKGPEATDVVRKS